MEMDMTPKDKHSDLRKKAEQILDADPADVFNVKSPEETRKLIHELRVHQVELEMQCS